jgi:hypothetical protein
MSLIPARLTLQRQWANDYPLPFLWKVLFTARAGGNMTTIGDRVNNILKKYERQVEGRGSSDGQWPVETKRITDLTREGGFMLVKSVAFPGEMFGISDVPIENDALGGIIPGYVSNSRAGYGSQQKLDVTFLDSNVDVVDYFIKPWIIAASHVGLIEQDDDRQDIKCTIDIQMFTRDKSTYNGDIDPTRTKDLKMSLRKQFRFHNAVPFITTGKEISYGDFSISDLERTISFAFSHYNTVSVANK